MKDIRNQKNSEILEITANRPWIVSPHTVAMRLDPLWRPFDYLVQISKILAQTISSGNARIILCAPPRSGKTSLVILHLILFYLCIWPLKHILFFTHSESFAEERVRLVRNTIIQNRKHLPIRLAEDSQSMEKFNTVQGGGLRGLGIGSALSGLPSDLTLVDDIYSSWHKSQNEREREKVISWFCDSYSRLNPNASIVVCGARWHQDDLQGWLIKHHSDDWQVLNFPALSQGKSTDLLRREKGDPLCPAFYDKKALKKIEKSIGPKKWAAQYMQEPLPDRIKDDVEVVFPEDYINKIKESPFPPLKEPLFSYSPETIHYIGLDIGGKRSYSVIVVCQLVETDDPDASQLHIIHLQRFPLNTKLRMVIEELDVFSLNPTFGELCPIIIFDGSGLGGEQAAQLMHEKRIKPVIQLKVISTGKGSTSKGTVPKKDLIENLQDFISEGRLKIPSRLKDANLLLDELRGYRRKPSPQGRTITFRPTGRDGKDDLLDGLSLICWAVFKRWKPLYARQAEGLYEDSLPTRRPISRNRRMIGSNLERSLYAQNNIDCAMLRGWI